MDNEAGPNRVDQEHLYDIADQPWGLPFLTLYYFLTSFVSS